MAREKALSVYTTNDSTLADLSEEYGDVLEAVENLAVSTKVKNKSYVQSPNAGSIEIYRLQTAGSQTYGTARSGGAGDKVKRDPVTINLSVHKEIVEEWKANEIKQAGLPDLVARRRDAHAMTFVNDLDTAFFAEAVAEGTSFDASGESTTATKVSALIREVEATSNDYILNGVDRRFLALTVTPTYWDALEDYIFTLPNPANGGVTMQTYKGVQIFKNLNQTKDAICMALESVAQPVNIVPYEAEIVPLSNDQAVKMFYDYGTQAVMSDLIQYTTLGTASA